MVYLGVFSIYQISLRLEKPDKILYNFKKYEILKYSLFIWTIGRLYAALGTLSLPRCREEVRSNVPDRRSGK